MLWKSEVRQRKRERKHRRRISMSSTFFATLKAAISKAGDDKSFPHFGGSFGDITIPFSFIIRMMCQTLRAVPLNLLEAVTL